MNDYDYFEEDDYEVHFDCTPSPNVSHKNDEDHDDKNCSHQHEKEEIKSEDVEPNYVFPDDETIKDYVFDSIDEAERFYCAYALHHGFDVSRKSVRKDGSNVIARLWTCTCEGYNEPKIGPPRVGRKGVWKARLSKKCGCEASFRVKFDRDDRVYKVTNLINTHNHILATSVNKKKLKSSRIITASEKTLFTTFRASGMRTRDGINFIARMKGGYEFLGFDRKDAYNHINKEKMEMIKEGDVKTSLSFLEGMRQHDPDIIIKAKRDDNDNTLTCIFFTDGHSRMAYKKFGDVVVFDSTYKTNCYGFVLVIFSGVDNHKKNCVFGTAIMKEETIPAYTWLLQEFLNAMDGKEPKSVLTDQDKSMRAAIVTVFPNAKHRICCWHLVRNATQHIKAKGFKNDFASLLTKFLTPEEFEDEWSALIEKHGLVNNTWTSDTYLKREHWAEAYFRGHFMGMMRSTQRAESLNSLFKEQGKSGNTILELLKHYHDVLKKIRWSFITAQEKAELCIPVSNHRSGMYSFQKDAASVYTEAVFCEVLNEINGEQSLRAVGQSVEAGPIFNYTFVKYWEKNGESWDVDIDEEDKIYFCTCQKLQSDGIPCRHLFAAFKQMGRATIPPECILPRWTISIGKDLKNTYSKPLPVVDTRDTRMAKLFVESIHHDWVAAQTNNAAKNAIKRTRKSTNKAQAEIDKENEKDQDEPVPKKIKEEYDIKDPKPIQSKGAKKGGKQQCSLCKLFEHKAPRCPLNPKNTTQD